MNYTVVVASPVRFGVPAQGGWPREPFYDELPFGGVEADLPFRCVGVGVDQPSVMHIFHTGRTSPANMTINGREIPGGLPKTNTESTRVVRDTDGPDRRVTDISSIGPLLTPFILAPGTLRDDNTLRIFGSPNFEPQPFRLYSIVVFFQQSTRTHNPIDPNIEILR